MRSTNFNSVDMHEKFQFQNTVTLGNIISTAAIVASLIGCILHFDSRMVVLETRLPYLERGLLDNAAATKNLSEAQASLARAMERVTVLLEERIRKP